MNPKISVIMLAYNEENHITKSLTSLLNQTISPNEIIIIDDGSTDKTNNILQNFQVNHRNIKVFKVKRTEAGALTRYSALLKLASCQLSNDFDFIGWLDADTVLESFYYEKLIHALQRNNIMGMACGSLIGEKHGDHIYGCNRLYTGECWFKLNNGKTFTAKVLTPDTYHEFLARKLGYHPRKVHGVQSRTLRPTTRSGFNKGYCLYPLNYSLWFILGKALKEFSPLLIAGYFRALLSRQPKNNVKEITQTIEISKLKQILFRSVPKRTHFETKQYWEKRAYLIAESQTQLTFHPLYKWISNVIHALVNACLSESGLILKCDLWNEGLLDRSWFDLKNFNLPQNVSAVGVDISLNTCKLAKQRTNNAMIVCADLNYLPFKENSFCLVLDLSTIDHIPRTQVPEIFMNIKHVLAQDGKFITIFHPERRFQIIMDSYIKFWEKLKHTHWSFGIKYFFRPSWIRTTLEKLRFNIIYERPLNIGGFFPFTRFLCKSFPKLTNIMDKIETNQPPLSEYFCDSWIFIAEKGFNF